MFTGIIEAVGTVARLETRGGNLRMTLKHPFGEMPKLGSSLAVDGVCLTVTKAESGIVEVESVAETLGKTSLDGLREGSKVNLERAIRVGDRLDGHIVLGHVDDTGVVRKVQPRDGSRILSIAFPPEYLALVVPKGSITIQGISLTIATLRATLITVSIIPATWESTSLSALKIGSKVNLEFDILGKYLVRSREMGIGLMWDKYGISRSPNDPTGKKNR